MLVAENQITQNEVLAGVRSLAGNSGPTVAGGKLQPWDPHVARTARIQIKIDVFDYEIVRVISDYQCYICKSNPLRKYRRQCQLLFRMRFAWGRSRRIQHNLRRTQFDIFQKMRKPMSR